MTTDLSGKGIETLIMRHMTGTGLAPVSLILKEDDEVNEGLRGLCGVRLEWWAYYCSGSIRGSAQAAQAN